jgi:hypothetical protein
VVAVVVALPLAGGDGLVVVLVWSPAVAVGVGVTLAEPPEKPVARPAPPRARVPCRRLGDVDEVWLAADVEPGLELACWVVR